MKLTWIGGAGFVLELGAFRVVADPVFVETFDLGGTTVERRAPAPELPVGDVDLLCISCNRPDHFDDTAVEKVGAARAVAPAEVGHGEPLAWWDAITLEKNGETLVVTAIPAVPGVGHADNGYFFTHTSGEETKTAYWTGDALWSNDAKEVQKRLGYANLLVQHIGAEASESVKSPTAKEAMQFVYRMQPNAIVAVHHHTFSHYNEDVEPFADLLSRTIYEKRLHVLKEGESFKK